MFLNFPPNSTLDPIECVTQKVGETNTLGIGIETLTQFRLDNDFQNVFKKKSVKKTQ